MKQKYLTQAISPYSELDPDMQRLRLSRIIHSLNEHLMFPIGKFSAFYNYVDGANYVTQVRVGGFRYFLKGATPAQAYALAQAQYAMESFTKVRIITRILDVDNVCGETVFAVFDEVLRQSVHKYGDSAAQLWNKAGILEVQVSVAGERHVFSYVSTGKNMAAYLDGDLVLSSYMPYSLDKVLKDTKPNIFGECLEIQTLGV